MASMEEKKNQPNIPSNYVTLLQLQERWIKEQRRKQKEKEEEEEEKQKQQQLQKDEQREKNLQAQGIKEAKSVRSNSTRKYHGNILSSKVSSRGSFLEETDVGTAVFVEGKENESAAKEIKSKELRIKRKKNRKKKNKNKREGDKKKEDGEQVEKEVIARETRTALVKSEKESIPVSRYVKKRPMPKKIRPKINNVAEVNDEGETRAQLKEDVIARETRTALGKSEKESIPLSRYVKNRPMMEESRPKINNVVEVSDMTEEIGRHIENVVQESNRTLDIEQKFGDLSVANETSGAERQNRVVNGWNTQYRGDGNVINRGNRGYRGHKDKGAVSRGYMGYKGYNGGVARRNGQHPGWYGRFNPSRELKEKYTDKVWVRKKEAADGDDVAGNRGYC